MVDTVIQQRAKQLGIADAYWDIDGGHHFIDETTLQYFIDALENVQLSEESFAEVLVLPAEKEHTLPISPKPDKCTLLDEHGRLIDHTFFLGQTNQLKLPALPLGYYTLVVNNGKIVRWRLIIAPQSCYRPAILDGRQLHGLTLQLYSLRSESDDKLRANWGIGDFADLYDAITVAQSRGLDFIGINPLHALYPSKPEWCSPYSPSSRTYLHWIYLSVGQVPEFYNSPENLAWLDSIQTQLNELRQTDTIDYRKVSSLKMQALRKAFESFNQLADRSRQLAFKAFIEQGGNTLAKHSAFYAISAFENDVTLGSLGFPNALQDSDSTDVADFMHQNDEEVRFYSYLQWLIDEQLTNVQNHAQDCQLALGIYGDLAVGVAVGSADAWVNPDLYALPASVGAPPDPLGPVGQNWGLPPMHPVVLKQQGFQPFIETLRANMKHCGALRIDHVMSLYRLWLIPEGKDACHGAYIHYPFETLMAILAIESQRAQCLIIGEDLGTVPNEVREALDRYQVLSYDVLYFGGRYEDNDYLRWRKPDTVNREALGVVGTHDLPSLAGWWHCRDLDVLGQLGILDDSALKPMYDNRLQDKQALLNALKADGYLPDNYHIDAMTMAMHEQLNQAIHAYARDAGTRLFGIQPENFCEIDWAFNVPGTTTEVPNWRRKLPCPLRDISPNLPHKPNGAPS